MTTMKGLVVGLVVLGWAGLASAQDPKAGAAAAPAAKPASETTMVEVQAKDLKWGDVPPSLPKGAKIAVLQGDLVSGPWTIRAELPAKYKIMPHTHPTMEHVTVISGTCGLGMGEKVDEKAMTKLGPGGFAALPADMVHYAVAVSKTVIQVHGVGPFEIKYVDPKDDPRNAPPAAAAATPAKK